MAQMAHWNLSAALQAIDERRWLRHGLFWLVGTGVMTWLLVGGFHKTHDVGLAFRNAVQMLVPNMLATYALLYGVLPALWRPGSQGRFGLLLVAWFVGSLLLNYTFRYVVVVVSQYFDASVLLHAHRIFASGAYMPLLETAGVAACLRLYRRWRHKQLANTHLAQENYQAELQLLKAQIHPHFLFNTLNNLYALTLKQSDQAPEVVERLTGLLQFVVEQGSKPLVPLPDEVTLLRNYLALEKLRYGSRLTLHFQADDIPATGSIAPLLLLPLVENAFKHGSSEQLGQAHIHIALAVEGDWFSCVITNSKNLSPAEQPDSPGIGLRNVRQRLQLLYPHRHRFETESCADTFTTRLALRLQEVPVATEAPVPTPPAWSAQREPAPSYSAAPEAAAVSSLRS